MNRSFLVISLLLASVMASCQVNRIEPSRQWSSYRGYYSSGFLDDAGLPESWDAESGENILWSIDIPGLALSSPVTWGDKVFITTAISEADSAGLRTFMSGGVQPVEDMSEHKWKVLCIDRLTGKTIWEDTPYTGVPKIKRHPMSTHANSSMATDGKYAVAFFGSEGLYCYNMDGDLLWEKNFGVLKSVFFIAESAEWEFASSPIIHNGVVLVQVDVLDNSFVAAFSAEDGSELWRTTRDEYPGWSSPNIYNYDGNDYVVVNGFKHRGAYDFKTGEPVWNMSGGGDIPIPTPVIGEEFIYFNSAHGRSSPILAVRKDAKDDITLAEGETTNSGIAWSYPRGGSYMQTMVLYRGLLYNLRLNGQVQCYDALTGEEVYTEKIGKAEFFLSSPVAADGYVYLVSVPGEVYRIKAGRQFEIDGTFTLGDVCMTTPAITDGVILFRTEHGLLAAGKK